MMTVKRDATIWSVTLISSIMVLELSFALLEVSVRMFMVQESLMINVFDRYAFTVQANGFLLCL